MKFFTNRRLLSPFGRKLEKISPYIETILLPLFVICGYYLGVWLHWWECMEDAHEPYNYPYPKLWDHFVRNVILIVSMQCVFGIFLAHFAYHYGCRMIPLIQMIVRIILFFAAIDALFSPGSGWIKQHYNLMWYTVQFGPVALFGFPLLLHWWAYCCVERGHK